MKDKNHFKTPIKKYNRSVYNAQGKESNGNNNINNTTLSNGLHYISFGNVPKWIPEMPKGANKINTNQQQ